jgi:NDP-sugar pyrophosphorylase family protein
VSKIKIGSHSTIGDRTVVHGRSQPETPTLIGNHVTVEQGCILHACTIMDKSVVRDLSAEEIKAIEATSEKHTGLSQKHLQFHQLSEDERAQLEYAESNQLPTASAKPQF